MENNLKLISVQPKEEKPKKLTWLQERINDFLQGFQEATGRKCPIPYQQLVGMLATKANNAMGGWATIGEDGKDIIPSYPEMDVWREQREAFFRDEFAATKAGFGFGYFLKQFGTFVKYKPAQQENFYICEACKERVKRSNKDSHRYNCKAGLDYWLNRDAKIV